MNRKLLLAVFISGLALLAMAGPLTRLGHTALSPRNTNPDDKGMYGACIDPVRGFAYFGQDSRPNQIIKVQLAKTDPFTLTGARFTNNGAFTFGFTNWT